MTIRSRQELEPPLPLAAPLFSNYQEVDTQFDPGNGLKLSINIPDSGNGNWAPPTPLQPVKPKNLDSKYKPWTPRPDSFSDHRNSERTSIPNEREGSFMPYGVRHRSIGSEERSTNQAQTQDGQSTPQSIPALQIHGSGNSNIYVFMDGTSGTDIAGLAQRPGWLLVPTGQDLPYHEALKQYKTLKQHLRRMKSELLERSDRPKKSASLSSSRSAGSDPQNNNVSLNRDTSGSQDNDAERYFEPELEDIESDVDVGEKVEEKESPNAFQYGIYSPTSLDTASQYSRDPSNLPWATDTEEGLTSRSYSGRTRNFTDPIMRNISNASTTGSATAYNQQSSTTIRSANPQHFHRPLPRKPFPQPSPAEKVEMQDPYRLSMSTNRSSVETAPEEQENEVTFEDAPDSEQGTVVPVVTETRRSSARSRVGSIGGVMFDDPFSTPSFSGTDQRGSIVEELPDKEADYQSEWHEQASPTQTGPSERAKQMEHEMEMPPTPVETPDSKKYNPWSPFANRQDHNPSFPPPVPSIPDQYRQSERQYSLGSEVRELSTSSGQETVNESGYYDKAHRRVDSDTSTTGERRGPLLVLDPIPRDYTELKSEPEIHTIPEYNEVLRPLGTGKAKVAGQKKPAKLVRRKQRA